VGRVLAIVFVAYAALTLWVTLHHEPWRDEADTWLIARDATLGETLRIPAHRGVPLLWDFLLRPFAKAGVPYLAQQLLNLACMWGAVLLLMRSRAFPPLLKIVFPFSFYASYEYAAIARPYALLTLLLFAMAECWRTRGEKPVRLAIVLALLANVTVHGLFAAAVAGALLLIEWVRARRFGAPAIVLFGGLLSLAQLWPRPGGQKVYQLISIDTLWYTFAAAFFPDLRTEPGAVLGLFVLAVITIAIARNAVPPLWLWTTLAAVLAVFVFLWMGGYRHAGIVLVLAITALWMADAYGPLRQERLAMAALTVALAMSIVPAYRLWSEETRLLYGGGRLMARYVRANGLTNANFAGGALMWNSWLLDLPPVRLWLAPRGEYGSFWKWEQREGAPNAEEAIRAAQEHYRGQRWFLMLSRPVPKAFAAEFRLRYATPPLEWGQRDERYFLYEAVKP
jgi:hypothetical protein